MKLKTIVKSLITLSAAFVLGACGNNASSSASSSNAQSSGSELKTVKISSVGSDADIWRYIADSEQAKKAGLKIEVQEINGGVSDHVGGDAPDTFEETLESVRGISKRIRSSAYYR